MTTSPRTTILAALLVAAFLALPIAPAGSQVLGQLQGSAPRDLHAAFDEGTGEARLEWLAPDAIPGSVDHYLVYRDGANVAATPLLAYVDALGGFDPGTYAYQVSAVHDGVEGARTLPAAILKPVEDPDDPPNPLEWVEDPPADPPEGSGCVDAWIALYSAPFLETLIQSNYTPTLGEADRIVDTSREGVAELAADLLNGTLDGMEGTTLLWELLTALNALGDLHLVGEEELCRILSQVPVLTPPVNPPEGVPPLHPAIQPPAVPRSPIGAPWDMHWAPLCQERQARPFDACYADLAVYDGDLDQDGITNLAEFMHLTSPLDADTDHDGLLDGEEMDLWGHQGHRLGGYDTQTCIGAAGTQECRSLPYTNPCDLHVQEQHLKGSHDEEGGYTGIVPLAYVCLDAYLDTDGDLIPNHSDPDSDNDGLRDGEEYRGRLCAYDYASNVHVGGYEDEYTDYPDGLGWTCRDHAGLGTDPGLRDTDADTLVDGGFHPTIVVLGPNSDERDGEVFDYDTDPLLFDTDGDALDDGSEVQYMTRRGLDATAAHDPDGDGASTLRDEDADEDGLADGGEVASTGTDPYLPDTEGDWMPDKFEVDETLLPLANDAEDDRDQDGLTNLFEYCHEIPVTPCNRWDHLARGPYHAGGLPVNDPDADDDLALDGREIALTTNPRQWDTDQDAMPDGWEDQHGLQPLLGMDAFEDLDEDYLDVEFDGTPSFRYRNLDEYRHARPAMHDEAQDGAWNAGTLPEDKDSDDDGMWDSWEVHYGNDPLDPADRNATDFDQDGLTYPEEHAQNSNPFLADTDADGLCDGGRGLACRHPANGLGGQPGEKDYGTNPRGTDSDADGLTDAEEALLWDAQATGLASDADGDGLNGLVDPDGDGDNLGDGAERFTYGTRPEAADSDADGLRDDRELFATRTSPLDPDHDKDGLNDGAEVDAELTDPLDPDSDGDALLDGAEVNAHHTEPLQFDTDGDGMDDGWEVRYGLQPLAAADAQLDGDGDTLWNLKEYQIGTDPMRVDSDGDSMRDDWEDRYALDPASPADRLGDPDGEGLPNWEEHAHGAHPRNPDTDGDGLDDAYEVRHGLDPANAADAADDADADGLTNAQERGLGTDPARADTDQDGMPDGWEYVHGLNPLSPADAASDLDADGLANLPEFQRGTDPADADSDDDLLMDGPEALTYASNPLSPHSDADGFMDGAEEAAWLAEGYAVLGNPDGDGLANGIVDDDADGDGLNDTAEFRRGARPDTVDSDGDGLCDGGGTPACASRPGEDDYQSDANATDSDRDGLTDGAEATRWDPQGTGVAQDVDLDGLNGVIDRDADGDGLGDGSEVGEWSTDPGKADTDGDRLSDGAEAFQHQSNPLSNDTDADGFSDGDEAEVTGTSLTEDDTDQDGLADRAESVTWGTDPLLADSDGDRMDDGYEARNGLQPTLDDAGLDQDDMTMQGDGLTNAAEWAVGSDPWKFDSDGDLMGDWWEVSRGRDPAHDDSQTDWDGDGLTALQEVSRTPYTSPDDPDTDDDGLGDAVENLPDSDASLAHSDGDRMPDGEEREAWIFLWTSRGEGLALWADPDGDGKTVLMDSDADGDGIDDGSEFTLHTRPDRGDTDADGLSDHQEIYQFQGQFDPLDPDTDDDGEPDGQELLRDPNADPDGDGLTNAQEDQYGTYKLWEDSDCDGVRDLAELNYWRGQIGTWMYGGANLLQTWDADFDTVPDGAEIGHLSTDPAFVIVTNPLSDDSDGDGLADGWERHNEAKASCDPNGPRFLPAVPAPAAPAAPSTPPLAPHVPRAPVDPFKAAVAGPLLHEVWKDTEGRLGLEEGSWFQDAEGRLYRLEAGTGALVILGSFGVQLYAPVPTMRPQAAATLLFGGASPSSIYQGTTSAGDRDSDRDGVPDGDEVMAYLTDPTRCDSDQDRLGDALEVGVPGNVVAPGEPCRHRDADTEGNSYTYYGGRVTNSDPTKADSDGDGVPDGEEDADEDGKATVIPAVSPPRPTVPGSRPPPSPGQAASHYQAIACAASAETLGSDGDSDDDGLSDTFEIAQEAVNNVRLSPTCFDSDFDGLSDGVEMGVGPAVGTIAGLYIELYGHRIWKYPPTDGSHPVYADHAQAPTIRTDPRNPDSDADGIPDGMEDLNQNGRTDCDDEYGLPTLPCSPGEKEMDPTMASTDGDELPDGLELLINAKGSRDYFGQFLDFHQEDFKDELQFDASNPWETNPLSKHSDPDGAEDGKDLNPRADDVFVAIDFGEFYMLEDCDYDPLHGPNFDCEFFVKEIAIGLPFTDADVKLQISDTGSVSYRATRGHTFPPNLIHEIADQNEYEVEPDYMKALEVTWKVMQAGTGPILAVQLPNRLIQPDGSDRLDMNDRTVTVDLTLGEDDPLGTNDAVDLDSSDTSVAAHFELNLADRLPLSPATADGPQTLSSFRPSISSVEADFFRFKANYLVKQGQDNQHELNHNEDGSLEVRMGDNLPTHFMEPVGFIRQSLPVQMPPGECWAVAEDCVRT